MSGGVYCRCDERAKPLEQRRWIVVRFKHNRSAFNGYHRTPSDYSSVKCEVCLATWRTKAGYVASLMASGRSGPQA